MRDDNNEEDYPICTNDKELSETLKKYIWDNNSYYPSVVSILQAISTIRKGRKKREITNQESRGAKIRRLEDSIANLDNQQSRAVIENHILFIQFIKQN